MRYMGASLNGGFYPNLHTPSADPFFVGVFPRKLLGEIPTILGNPHM